MKRFVFAVCLLASILGATKPAAADLITYTESFTGSGTLNGFTFTNATVVLSGTGDTSDIAAFGSTLFINDAITMTANIGLATVTFSDTFSLFVNQAPFMQLPVIGFQDNNGNIEGELASANSSSFGSYNLGGPLAPVTASSGPGVDTIDTYSTNRGSLTFTGGTGPVTVSALSAPTAVPEPSSLAIAMIGGVCVGCYTRRTWRKRAA
jgi:hypothetical protein